MRIRSALLAVVLALVGSVASMVPASPVAAEIVTPQSTWWGLATPADTDNLDRWTALGWATEPVGGMMIVGGKFLDTTNGSSTQRQPYLAAFDAGDGRFLTWWRPNVGGAVTALETTPDGGLVVGGEMGTWEGVEVGALQKIDPATGAVWPGWSTRVYGGSSIVRDVRLEPDGWLYVVGTFTTASDNGVPFAVQGAIRMDPVTGAIDRNWIPQVSGGSVWGVSRSRTTDEVYLAGWFTSVAGNSTARGFAGVSSSTAALIHTRSSIPYNTCLGCTSYHRFYDVVATEHGTVFVGGEQHALFVLDETTNLSMDLMHYTGCNLNVRAFCTNAGGEFQEIERIGDRIYATCHCWGDHVTSTSTIYHSNRPSGTPTGTISGIAAYDPLSGQRISSFNPKMSGKAGGFAIAGASDGCVWTAGGYSSVGNPGATRSGRDLVRLCDQAGPGPDPAPNPTPPAPTACLSTNVGTAATVSWTNPAGATAMVIERRVGNGNWSWRARVIGPVAEFSEAVPNGQITTYRVKATYDGGQSSLAVECAPPIDLSPAPDVAAPLSCTAANVATAATITWEPSAGAVDYRVFRSVDGSTPSWRGLTTATTLADTLRTTGSQENSVQARGMNGVWSAGTICAPALVP